MKTKLVFATFMLSVGLAAAQDKLGEKPRKAIVEEEANQNLNKAIEPISCVRTTTDW